MKPPRQLIGVVDQGLSSVGNLLLSVWIARAATAAEFGEFAVAFTVYLVGLSIGRGVVGAVASLRLSQLERSEALVLMRVGAGVSILVGASLGTVGAIASPFLPDGMRDVVLIVAVAMPVLLLQDAARYFAYSLERPSVAVLNDGIWLLVQIVFFLILSRMDLSSSQYSLAAWAAAAAIGTLAGLWVLQVAPSFRKLTRWWREFSSLIKSLLTEQAFISGVAQGAPFVVGGVSGAGAVGQLRGAQTIFGPLTAFNTGLSLAVVPTAAKRWARGNARFFVPLVLNGSVTAGVTLAWGALLHHTPAAVGEFFLGDSWVGVRDLVAWTAIWLALSFSSAPAISALRIIGREWDSAIIRIAFAPLMLGGAAYGALHAGAYGATVALTCATCASAMVLWLTFSVRLGQVRT